MDDTYFKKWLDERFKELGSKIDDLKNTTDKEIIKLDHRIQTLEDNDKWQNQKIWIAMGIVIAISGFAVYFLSSFKNLNELQVTKSVEQAFKNRNL
jgi:hypothetical protein